MSNELENSFEEEQVLKGIQPRRQRTYKLYKKLKIYSIFGIILGAIFFALTFIKSEKFMFITGNGLYRKVVLILIGISLLGVILSIILRLLFLRKAKFDDWVFEIASSRLGTSVIFYDSKNIYIEYKRTGKHVEIMDFVTEMSDKSVLYSYYYVKSWVNQGLVQIQCQKKQAIPDRALFDKKDDTCTNIIPLGLTINNNTQKISPIGWWLNDNKKNKELLQTNLSVSLLICGGTGSGKSVN